MFVVNQEKFKSRALKKKIHSEYHRESFLFFFFCFTMSYIQFYSRTFLLLSLLFINVLTSILPHDVYNIEKRQIGVLARTGALPQGKRSVEVLARNGELPHLGGKKNINTADIQDLLIDELENAESLSKMRAQTLAERIFEEKVSDQFGTDKRSVSALARNGELPQKRLSEALSRSGYLIKPSQESVQSPLDLLDPDDFLVDGQWSTIPEVLDERNLKHFISTGKRSLNPTTNFLLDSEKNSVKKKNLASLARDGGFTSLLHPLMKERKVESVFESSDLHGAEKRNVDSFTNFNKREILGKCWNKYQTSESVVKGNNNQRKLEQFTTDSDYEEILPESISEEKAPEKRFLGRIPQLGRIHQKVQTPSARRRPHLRPNWL